MGISISVIFLFASLIIFWIVPAIGIAKNHLVDDRFFIRQWLFPMQYWLQLLFERISGNRRIVVRFYRLLVSTKSWQSIQDQIKLPLGKHYARLKLI